MSTRIAAACVVLAAMACGSSSPSPSSPSSSASAVTSEPPLLLKSIGVTLDYFNPATNMAGDFRFTKGRLDQGRIWMDFGYIIHGGAGTMLTEKANVQPTFLVPLGTKVRSLVDGIVYAVPQFGDNYSIQVMSPGNMDWMYETEHVINPLVRAGDRVSAGQIIAEVSPMSSASNDGLGLVEIGILHGGSPPRHVCPFAYLDPSFKAAIEPKIRAFYDAWESYRGDSTLYDQNSYPVIGCITLSPAEG